VRIIASRAGPIHRAHGQCVCAKQGKIKDALVKYDEALKYAPNWKELKEAREASAKHAT
jgi:hypothetical protein